MAAEITLEDAQKSLKGISIPPRPKLLTEINAELQKFSPNTTALATRIATDVGLSAAVLKVINSPYFGLRSKIGSVPTAVQLLGIQNVKSIVTGLLLKGALGGSDAMALEHFWDSSEKVAKISAYIASTLPRAPRDEAYTFGLFRECGVPLLMQRFDGYKETLQIAGAENRAMTFVEDEWHGTNHAVVGFMVAKTWGLPETLSEAILRHHDPEVLSESDSAPAAVRTLVAINYLAEFLNDTGLRMCDNQQWQGVSARVLSHLGVSTGELEDLQEGVASVLQ